MKIRYAHILGVIVAALAVIAVAVPGVGLYNPPRKSHVFWGEVTVNDTLVSGGLTVEAVSEGQVIAETTTTSDGIYSLQIPNRKANSVTFHVMGVDTDITREVKSGTISNVDLPVDDNEPPTITLSSPRENHETTSDNVPVSGTVKDDIAAYDEITLTVNGSDIEVEEDGSFHNTVDLEQGSNEVVVTAEDFSGNSTTVTREVTRTAEDDTPPTIYAEVPELVDTNTITVEGNVTDEVSHPEDISFSVDGDDVELDSTGEFSVEFSLSEGSNTIEMEATDEAGNTATETYDVTSDTEPPSVSIDSPDEGALLGEATATVEGTVSDDVAASDDIAVTLNGQPVTLSNNEFSEEVSLTEGENTIEVTAEDPAGNSASDDVTVTYDSAAPSITIDEPEDGETVDESEITVSGSVSDDYSDPAEISLSVAGTTASVGDDGSFEVDATLDQGTNDITVEATDEAGNAATETVTVEREDGTNWALYAAIIAIVAIILASAALWRQRKNKEA